MASSDVVAEESGEEEAHGVSDPVEMFAWWRSRTSVPSREARQATSYDDGGGEDEDGEERDEEVGMNWNERGVAVPGGG